MEFSILGEIWGVHDFSKLFSFPSLQLQYFFLSTSRIYFMEYEFKLEKYSDLSYLISDIMF